MHTRFWDRGRAWKKVRVVLAPVLASTYWSVAVTALRRYSVNPSRVVLLPAKRKAGRLRRNQLDTPNCWLVGKPSASDLALSLQQGRQRRWPGRQAVAGEAGG